MARVKCARDWLPARARKCEMSRLTRRCCGSPVRTEAAPPRTDAAGAVEGECGFWAAEKRSLGSLGVPYFGVGTEHGSAHPTSQPVGQGRGLPIRLRGRLALRAFFDYPSPVSNLPVSEALGPAVAFSMVLPPGLGPGPHLPGSPPARIAATRTEKSIPANGPTRFAAVIVPVAKTPSTRPPPGDTSPKRGKGVRELRAGQTAVSKAAQTGKGDW